MGEGNPRSALAPASQTENELKVFPDNPHVVGKKCRENSTTNGVLMKVAPAWPFQSPNSCNNSTYLPNAHFGEV
jgi:hypothetical protein